MKSPFIYVVDDQADFLWSMIALLRWRRFAADGTTDPIKAVHVIPIIKPDLLLIDQTMPTISGAEVIERVRGAGYKGKAIVFSGYEKPEGLPPGVAFLEKGPSGVVPIVNAITSELGLDPKHYGPERPRPGNVRQRIAEGASAI